MSTRFRRKLPTPQTFIPLEQETRSAIPTECAAHHLSRQPQTLRKWAMLGGVGNLKPFRINGRLMWPTAAIREVLNPSGSSACEATTAERMPDRILTTGQAEAIYAAMCELNNVGAPLSVRIPTTSRPALESGNLIEVYEFEEGPIQVAKIENGKTAVMESHADQSAFAAAYGIETGA